MLHALPNQLSHEGGLKCKKCAIWKTCTAFCKRLSDWSPAILTSDDFIRSNEIVRNKMADLFFKSNWPFCSNNLMISSERKKSRWSVYIYLWNIFSATFVDWLFSLTFCVPYCWLQKQSRISWIENEPNYFLKRFTVFDFVNFPPHFWKTLPK